MRSSLHLLETTLTNQGYPVEALIFCASRWRTFAEAIPRMELVCEEMEAVLNTLSAQDTDTRRTGGYNLQGLLQRFTDELCGAWPAYRMGRARFYEAATMLQVPVGRGAEGEAARRTPQGQKALQEALWRAVNAFEKDLKALTASGSKAAQALLTLAREQPDERDSVKGAIDLAISCRDDANTLFARSNAVLRIGRALVRELWAAPRPEVPPRMPWADDPEVGTREP